MEGFDLSVIPMDIILNLINIVLLYIIIRSLVYNPVKSFLSARNARVMSDLNKAAEDKTEAEKIRIRYNILMENQMKVADELIEMGKKKASDEADAIIKEAEKEILLLKQKAETAIDEEREKSMKEMKSKIASIAVGIAENILSREINDSDNRLIAEEYFNHKVSEKHTESDKRD